MFEVINFNWGKFDKKLSIEFGKARAFEVFLLSAFSGLVECTSVCAKILLIFRLFS